MREAVRADFPHLANIQTRWMDNDVYGHVNNVTYYSYFDTAVNQYLIEQGVLNIHSGRVVGLVVDTGCSYFRSIAFPDSLEVAIRVAKLGNSSVRYEVGVFRAGEEAICAAGHFVHVYVDRDTGRPVPLPDATREVLMKLRAESAS
ncbi:acyl-CoA thioesterase [Cupriavidus pauculus]|uniref:Thioesterase n=1 Tax=Cupriavidus pauculus TaxID=82633 RepID=A0A2N5C3D5_9BURK|nr:thioesterase family protein [Cupriavidus pauculus]PLP96725.1 thioesterase [Cupriavidus pauculus]